LSRNDKLSFSLVALLGIHIFIGAAGFFSPYDPAEQNRNFPLTPPMRLHFIDSTGRFHLRPIVCSWAADATRSGSPRYREDCTQQASLRFFVRTGTTAQGKIARATWHLFGVPAPARVFLLGTDDYGRDQWSRLLYGGQTSLGAGLLAAALSLALGLLLGCISGYFGSWTDDVIMRGAEIFLALPWIYLLFAVRAFLPLNLGARQAFLLLVSVIGITGWARPSRLIRGVVLSAKQRSYVLAARGFGASTSSIIWRHILPEVSPVALTQAALLIPQYILAEVTLSFLGLGVGEPEPSWGNMLAGLETYRALEGAHWWLFVSGLALIPIFLLFYWLADSLQERFQALDLAM
jgi:peptide/nickel transport system permease protein